MDNVVTEGAVGLTARLANFAVSFDLSEAPAQVVANAKTIVLDTLGVAAMAVTQDVGKRFLAFARDAVAPGPCTIWGTSHRASARDAALLNGCFAHALDFDDHKHMSTYCLPAPMAPVEQFDLPGAKLLEGFIVAREVRSSLELPFGGREVGVGPGGRGWHGNGIMGPIGAACGAGKVPGLDHATMVAAIGIAAGSNGALNRDNGMMSKAYRCGTSASNGLNASLLAKNGITGDPTILEGRTGLLDALGPMDANIIDGLGKNLGCAFQLKHLSGKPYASVTTTQGQFEAMLRIRQKTPFGADDIETIDVDIKFGRLARDIPATGYEGKFSMRYCLALAVVRGSLGPRDFDDDTWHHPSMQAVMDKVRNVEGSRKLTVTLKDGRRLDEPVKRAGDLTTTDQFEAKFRDCVSGILPDDRAQAIIDIVDQLETQPSVHPLMELMRTEVL
jgi:2-methylcitrate dehydratase PrpD